MRWSLSKGKAAYRKEGKELEISSRLSSGHSYSFTFVISKKDEDKAKEDKKATDKRRERFRTKLVSRTNITVKSL